MIISTDYFMGAYNQDLALRPGTWAVFVGQQCQNVKFCFARRSSLPSTATGKAEIQQAQPSLTRKYRKEESSNVVMGVRALALFSLRPFSVQMSVFSSVLRILFPGASDLTQLWNAVEQKK